MKDPTLLINAYVDTMPNERWATGDKLCVQDQLYVLNRWTNRYTGQHTPQWVLQARKFGRQYSVHFDSDDQWLQSSAFRVRKDGRLDKRYNKCQTQIPWWHPSKYEAP